ncbi:protein PALS2-like [Dysidea avara]|uniref:protein PALS2-like n=1 Tax=Dysidea avara TaxID=196820 RepID=UPI00332F7BC2
MGDLDDNAQEDLHEGPVKGVFEELSSALDVLQTKSFAESSDIAFLKQFVSSPVTTRLCEVHDMVYHSQEMDQPEPEINPIIDDVNTYIGDEHLNSNERLLHALLADALVKELFNCHDVVKKRQYDKPVPQLESTPFIHINRDSYKTVGLHKSSNESLGMLLVKIEGKVYISRILHGGLIHRQGLLKVGDNIVEVNNEDVGHLTLDDLQDVLKGSSGNILIKVRPSTQEPVPQTEVYVKANFNYSPKDDKFIPTVDIGLEFQKGDILRILNQDETHWWQAVKHGSHQVAGLIPSNILEERRRAFVTNEGAVIGCIGQRRSKRHMIYSSHHSGEFEGYDMVLYENVTQVQDFRRKTLVLIGPQFIGRKSLKSRLIADNVAGFGQVMPCTSRERRAEEINGSALYHFVSEGAMKADINAHRYIEFGKHKQHLYGIKMDSVIEVIESGRMCVVDVNPQAIKMLRNRQFAPLIVFIKAGSPDSVRKLHQNVVMQSTTRNKLTDEDYVKCSQESAEIERIYSPYFDASILNEDIDLAYEELLQVIRQHTTGQQWVPTDWIY